VSILDASLGLSRVVLAFDMVDADVELIWDFDSSDYFLRPFSSLIFKVCILISLRYCLKPIRRLNTVSSESKPSRL
jgi:hypothetical protein